MQSIVPLIGRVLLAAIFLISGYRKLFGFAGLVGYIGSKGLPAAQLLAVAAIVIELAGGLMLLVGWKTRVAAAALAVFTVVATIFFHNFWAFPADQMQNQINHFLKNLAIIGGFLYVIAFGAGQMSIDEKKRT